MLEHLLVALVSIIVLGICAQWIAWRFRLPSILILLALGFVAGPITGFIAPDQLFGSLLFPVVSLSVSIILFEGGLSLRLEELSEVGRSVRNLVTIGVLVTWAGTSVLAYYLIGLNLALSILIGSLLVVTGPTVIVPLLRHIRPVGRIGAVTKWEGIVVDPIGAILSVLVLEMILFLHKSGAPGIEEAGIWPAVFKGLEGLFLTTAISSVVALIGAGVLVLMFQRRHVPDHLQNPVVLMVVSAAFALANLFQEESGLMAVTLMGILMANQDFVPVRRIVEFKEDLRVLLIGGLFIVLSARLQPEDLQYISAGALLFLLLLMFAVRPAAVFLSSLGTNLNWREKVFLSWMAPRGIVAAAVVSVFGFDLQEVYPEQVGALVPVVFLVIVGTVTIYGLSALPLARWLGLADPDPQGVLFIGAEPWVQKMAEQLQAVGIKVFLIDAEGQHIAQAQQRGLPAQQVDVLAEGAIEKINYDGIGHLLAVTSGEKVNSLAALHFYEIFDSANIYQLSVGNSATESQERLPKHLRGHPLFEEGVTYTELVKRLEDGHEIVSVTFSDEYSYDDLKHRYTNNIVPLFLVRNRQRLYIYSDKSAPAPKAGETMIALVSP